MLQCILIFKKIHIKLHRNADSTWYVGIPQLMLTRLVVNTTSCWMLLLCMGNRRHCGGSRRWYALQCGAMSPETREWMKMVSNPMSHPAENISFSSVLPQSNVQPTCSGGACPSGMSLWHGRLLPLCTSSASSRERVRTTAGLASLSGRGLSMLSWRRRFLPLCTWPASWRERLPVTGSAILQAK